MADSKEVIHGPVDHAQCGELALTAVNALQGFEVKRPTYRGIWVARLSTWTFLDETTAGAKASVRGWARTIYTETSGLGISLATA